MTVQRKLLIFVGSLRSGSRSRQAAQVFQDAVRQFGYQVEVFDPLKRPLHLPGYDTQKDDALSQRLREEVLKTDVVMFFVPEYDASYSAVTKCFVEFLGYPSALAGKLTGVVGIAAGRYGAVKSINHVTSMLNHIGCFIIPKQINIVTGVQQSLTTPDTAVYNEICSYGDYVHRWVQSFYDTIS